MEKNKQINVDDMLKDEKATNDITLIGVDLSPDKPEENIDVVQHETKENNISPMRVTGIVSDCVKLNIRKTPSIGSPIISVVNVGDSLTINLSESNEEWLAVTTGSGLNGFCMQEFVDII